MRGASGAGGAPSGIPDGMGGVLAFSPDFHATGAAEARQTAPASVASASRLPVSTHFDKPRRPAPLSVDGAGE